MGMKLLMLTSEIKVFCAVHGPTVCAKLKELLRTKQAFAADAADASIMLGF